MEIFASIIPLTLLLVQLLLEVTVVVAAPAVVVLILNRNRLAALLSCHYDKAEPVFPEGAHLTQGKTCKRKSKLKRIKKCITTRITR